MSKALQKEHGRILMKDSQTRKLKMNFLRLVRLISKMEILMAICSSPNVDRATFNQMVKELESSLIDNNGNPSVCFMMPNKEFGAL